MTARYTVTQREQVELLFNPQAARRLAPFFSSAETLSSAAALLGCAPSTMAYWIPRFVNVGLLVQERIELRAGAPMRWYRTKAPTLFVPHTSVPRVAFSTPTATADPAR